MARSYYGVPSAVSPDEDDSYYYEYEPLYSEQDEPINPAETSEFGPAQLIMFLMGLPFLPIWAALAIFGTSVKIGYFKSRDPSRIPLLELQMFGFVIFFGLGVLMYAFMLPRLMDFFRHIP